MYDAADYNECQNKNECENFASVNICNASKNVVWIIFHQVIINIG